MASRRNLNSSSHSPPARSPSPPSPAPVLELLEGRRLLATFTVNSLGDAGTGSKMTRAT